MSYPGPAGSVQCCAKSGRMLLIALLMLLRLEAIEAQEHDDDHDHQHLHFSHPLVTESPTPDTKIRLDYLALQTSGIDGLRENTVRLEGEYAFTDAVSLSVVAPFVTLVTPTDRVSGLGNIEVSLKGASLAFGERGLLFGGGLSAALPTGNDAKGIGSGHIVELEPFVDAGYKRHDVELVAFAALSSTFRRRPGEEAERNLTFDLSSLYRIQSRLEGLLEVTMARALVGAGSGVQQTFVAPGVKVYPLANRSFMFGASVPIGTGVVRRTRGLLLSGFYHF
jgi:hypothetical protein